MGATDERAPMAHRPLVFAFAALILGVAACAGAAFSGCSDVPAFACTANTACEQGHCIGGFCARADSACASGFRWDDSTGGMNGQCATYPDLIMVDPNCGNGKLDPGEQCDESTSTKCPTKTTCNDNEPCTNDVIVGSGCHRECVHTYDRLGEGIACPVDGGVPDLGPGICHNHVCCTGCVGGSGFCESGGAPGSCGTAGTACTDCAMGIGECQAPMCTGGGCGKSPVPNGTQCPTAGGLCFGGSCCTGCTAIVNNVPTCQPGNLTTACGTGGNPCASCGMGTCGNAGMCLGCVPNCANKLCGPNGCGGRCGTCAPGTQCNANFACECVRTTDTESTDALCSNGLDDNCDGKTDCADDGCMLHRCSGQSGMFCVNHACTQGCLVNGTFYPAGAVQGDPCHKCEPKIDNALVTANGVACTANGANGTCHGGACCTGCFDGNGCRSGTSMTACGAGGKVCADCASSCPGNVTCGVNCFGGPNCLGGNVCSNGACQANTTSYLCCPPNTQCQSIGGGNKDCQ